jgi:hypothetical protein
MSAHSEAEKLEEQHHNAQHAHKLLIISLHWLLFKLWGLFWLDLKLKIRRFMAPPLGICRPESLCCYPWLLHDKNGSARFGVNAISLAQSSSNSNLNNPMTPKPVLRGKKCPRSCKKWVGHVYPSHIDEMIPAFSLTTANIPLIFLLPSISRS